MIDKDIAFQATVELKIAVELARRWPGSYIKPNPKGKNSHHDFEILRPMSFEVKCDYKAKETRNLFFEVFNSYRKQPSGLTATKSWKWIHYVPGEAVAYVYSPETMLRWLESEPGLKKIQGGGDNNSDGFLVPVERVAKLPFVSTFEIML